MTDEVAGDQPEGRRGKQGRGQGVGGQGGQGGQGARKGPGRNQGAGGPGGGAGGGGGGQLRAEVKELGRRVAKLESDIQELRQGDASR
ncbi:MAG: hypothetical protein H0V49_09365 [Nocardioidaceae bacterium]|nr:hypothetical protein [Nocardioidaceae bacterium]